MQKRKKEEAAVTLYTVSSFQQSIKARFHKEKAVVRSENPEGHVVLDGYNMPSHLVEIGLTYLPKTGGGALAPPGPHL